MVRSPAKRHSILTALKKAPGAMSHFAERNLTFRGIAWRIEAYTGGKPFHRIALARSRLYSVEQVFLIHRETGLLLRYVAAEGTLIQDPDLVSGMLSAIQLAVSNSFAEAAGPLESVSVGAHQLWLTLAPKVELVGVIIGNPARELKGVFRQALENIDIALRQSTRDFEETDSEQYQAAEPLLKACLLGKRGKPR